MLGSREAIAVSVSECVAAFCSFLYRFMSVVSVLARLMADALLMRMSMPPNSATVASMALCTASSSRMSHCRWGLWRWDLSACMYTHTASQDCCHAPE